MHGAIGQPEQEEEAAVLVAVMNNRRDWERVQQEGWYRAPLRRAPRQLAAEYLAFYHTAAFAEEKWSIRWYAPILAARLARRRDLLPAEAGHPRADDLYYRFELGPLLALEPPLFSRRLRRITFIHTTLARLRQAGDVTDLWITPPLRQRLWVELNRQGVHAERDIAAAAGAEAPACDFVIPCQRDYVAVQCVPPMEETPTWREGDLTLPAGGEPPADWVWLRFEDAGWPVNLAPYVERIRQEVERRGGRNETGRC